MMQWPKQRRERTDQSIYLRVFINGRVRYSHWVEPEMAKSAVLTIRSVFRRMIPNESFAIVGDRDGVSVIILRT